jgi:hypothetical protein
MTKGEIDRLGEKIKSSSEKLKDPLLSELEAYRRQFKGKRTLTLIYFLR